MSASTSNEELQQEFLELLDYMRRTKARQEAKRRYAGLDPLALLERALRGALTLMERAIARVVRAIIR